MSQASLLKSLYEQVSEARSMLNLQKEQMEESSSSSNSSSSTDNPQSKKSKKVGGGSSEGLSEEEKADAHSALVLSKEAELLNSGTIDGLPGDDGIQYFLAIAEMQKNINNLRELKQMGESILRDNLEHGNLMDQMDDERHSMYKKLLEKMNAAQEQRNKEGEDNNGNDHMDDDHKERATIHELNLQLRGTREAYKEVKSGLTDFLGSLNKKDYRPFCDLLQALWTDYSNNLNKDTSGYLRISHLDFDVNQSDVNKLVSEGIILVDEKDPDRIRLMDFQR